MKRTIVAAIAGMILLAGVVVGVAAYGPRWQAGASQYWQANSTRGMGQIHERMQQVLGNGTYADLLQLRNETGMPMMPWIADQDTFQKAQAQYQQNEALYGNDSAYPGMMGGWRGGHGGCPMMDDD